jgi:beta-mannosidase
MQRLSLSGEWQFRKIKTSEWLPATVPGGVHTDLLALKRIPDPFAQDYEKDVQWVAESDWEYQRSFFVSTDLLNEEKIFLVCDGLDTLAEVIVNDRPLGKTMNMFRQYQWEIKSILNEGENSIRIAFSSPVQFCLEREKTRPLNTVSQAIAGGPHLRKAPCQFGWDWGPMLPPIGIWKDLRLEGYTCGRISVVHLRQQHTETRVNILAHIQAEVWDGSVLVAEVSVTSPDGSSRSTFTQPVIKEAAIIEIAIENPQLWWPNGYGTQPLYTVQVSLQDTAKKSLDDRLFILGLRTIELRQQPDEWGRSFQFVVNGVPIFTKGSNWIPADSFPTRLTKEHLENLVSSTATTHQNMLRIWGGGYYEDERLLDLCDRYGILIWHDFIFSCGVYPLDEPEFIHNVHQEILQNIRRLRHHACLALWCGNNEMEIGWVGWGWNKPDKQGLKAAYDQFFHHTLPRWVVAEDPDHPYWPSSPSSDTPFVNPNSENQGDMHYWDVWHGRKPFTAYRTTFPRFQSEFGFQSLPPLPTVKTYADETDWNMTSYIMEHHQRSWNGNGLMISQMTDTFRMPKDFPSLVYLSMLLQAEGIRYGVEHWRRNCERVAGTLYWQLNDCWPVASWASLDYFGRWKALHYLARRFYAPILLSILDEGKEMSVHITNDQVTSFYGEIRWRLETLDGKTISAGEETVLALPLANTRVNILDFNNLVNDSNYREVVFIAQLMYGEKVLTTAIATFAPNKHLSLDNTEIKTVVHKNTSPGSGNESITIEVSAKSLARFVELSFEGKDVIFSDNYFDIPAGQTVKITCSLPDGWTRDQARKALHVQSLYDSFA